MRSLRTRANSTLRKAHKLVADKVSEATVRRLAHRNRLQYGKPKRAAISEANVEARLKATTPAKVRLMQRHLHVLLGLRRHAQELWRDRQGVRAPLERLPGLGR